MKNQPNQDFLFTSKRLGYRLIKEEDFHDFLKLDSDPEVRAFFPPGILDADKVKAAMQQNQDFFTQHGFGMFAVIALETGEFVGRCGFSEMPTGEIEVGYVFLKTCWGKGYASEALMAMLAWAKEHIVLVDEIVAYTPQGHVASQRVMQKAGMRFYKQEVKDEVEFVFYQMVLREKE